MKESAGKIAAMGFPVFPVDRMSRKPKITGWPTEATTDAATVAGWWTRWPDASIGMPTGPRSGVWVLDIDGQEGEHHLEQYSLPDTTEVWTGRGRHLWWRWPEGRPVKNSVGRVGPALDVRGAGGYVVVPPSVHPSGRVYEFKIEPDELAEAPESLLRAVYEAESLGVGLPPDTAIRHPEKMAESILRRGCEQLAVMEEGGRNAALFNLGISLVPFVHSGHLDRERAEAELEGAAFSAGLGEREARNTIRSALSRVPDAQTLGRIQRGDTGPKQDGEKRPMVMVSADLRDTLDSVWSALDRLLEPPFRMADGGLCYVDEGQPVVLRPASVGAWISRHCDVRKIDGRTGVEAPHTLSADLRGQILGDNRGLRKLRPLKGVIDIPTFSGPRLITEVGYDGESGLYLWPRVKVEAPPKPEPEAIVRARGIIQRFVSGYRWADGASEANTVGAMLLPLVRGLHNGPTPAVWIDATQPGAGKSHLAKAIKILAEGNDGVTTLPTREEELEKRITSALIANPHTIFLVDNVRAKIEGGPLEALISSTRWEGRVLGRSEVVSVEHRCQVILTANSAQLSPDMARRVVPIRIERQPAGWSPPFDLLEVARGSRGAIVGALLTLVQGWLADGLPEAVTEPLATFEDATRIAGGVLEWAGVQGWLQGREQVAQEATFAELPTRVEEAIEACRLAKAEFTTHHLIERMDQQPMGAELRALQGAIRDALMQRGYRRRAPSHKRHPFKSITVAGRFWSPPPHP